MVKAIVIRITAEMVGLTRINLSQFSGYEIEVTRSGQPLIEDEDFQNLPSGGFDILGGAETILNERYAVTPLPKPIAQNDSTVPAPVSQYPHSVLLTTVSGSTQDGNGNWVAGEATITERIGRAEPSSGGRFLVGAGGDKIYYDFVLYMPLPAETIAAGTKVEVSDADLEVIASGMIKRFTRGQLNARAWI